MTARLELLRSRAAVLIVLTALVSAPAEARRLVEPGDLLVTAGDAVYAVRADGSGVAPFSPRAGSGPSQLVTPSGIAVDGGRGRVVVTDYFGKLLLVDPDDGGQIRVQNTLGGDLVLGDLVSGLDVFADGSLVLGSVEITNGIPFTTYSGSLYFVSTPTANGRAFATPASEPVAGGLAAPLLSVAVGEPSIGDTQLLASAITPFGSLLAKVNGEGAVTQIPGIPTQENAIVGDLDVDCSAGIASLCTSYWVELRVEVECVSSSAKVIRSNIDGTKAIASGSPLRCPLAVEVRPSDHAVFVLDANADFSDPRIHRLDYDSGSDEYTRVQITGVGELPDLIQTTLPGLAISPVALPEPGGGALAAFLGLALIRRAGAPLARARREFA